MSILLKASSKLEGRATWWTAELSTSISVSVRYLSTICLSPLSPCWWTVPRSTKYHRKSCLRHGRAPFRSSLRAEAAVMPWTGVVAHRRVDLHFVWSFTPCLWIPWFHLTSEDRPFSTTKDCRRVLNASRPWQVGVSASYLVCMLASTLVCVTEMVEVVSILVSTT